MVDFIINNKEIIIIIFGVIGTFSMLHGRWALILLIQKEYVWQKKWEKTERQQIEH